MITEKQREGERQKEGGRERATEIETDRERVTEIDTERETQRDGERERGSVSKRFAVQGWLISSYLAAHAAVNTALEHGLLPAAQYYSAVTI